MFCINDDDRDKIKMTRMMTIMTLMMMTIIPGSRRDPSRQSPPRSCHHELPRVDHHQEYHHEVPGGEVTLSFNIIFNWLGYRKTS